MPALPPTEAAPEGAEQVEWSETLHAWLFRARIYLKRYWWIFFITVSGGVGLQAYREYHRIPQYVSSATMTLRGRMIIPQGANYVDELSNFYATSVALMTSGQIRSHAQAIVQALHPELSPPSGLNVSAAQVNNANIIELSVAASVPPGGNPQYLQFYLNAVMKAFTDYKDEQREETLKFTQNQVYEKEIEYEQKITDLEAQRLAFLKANNLVSVARQSEDAGNEEALLRNNLAAAQSQLDALNASKLDDYVKGIGVEVIDQRLLEFGLTTTNQDYLLAKDQLLRLKAERDEFSINLRPIHPKLIALNQQIDQLENSLQVQRRQIVTQLEDRRDTLTADMVNLQDSVKKAQDRALQFSELQGEYENIDSDLDRAKRIHEQLVTSMTNIDLSQSLDQDLLTVLEPASDVAELAVNPMQQITEGAVAGFVAGAALIFLLGVLDGRVMSVEDFTRRFDEPVLGIIPMQKRIGGHVELLRSDDQRLMFAESCRNIRSSLLYMDRQGERPRTIIFTSSIPSEGKSTISSNLAITLGFAASRTLLIDADLRRGQLHKRFSIKNDIGLADHLQTGLPVEKIIHPTGFENLDIIPCGQYPDRPGELLMSDRFGNTIKELKEKYDFVIFDSPPILATDDAASFATRTDAVVFVIRAGSTRLRQIRASLESLYRRGVRVYGVVVNFIDHREPGYYSYKYYDYYSYRTPDRGKGEK
jgi:capsular exopolysaccharide synthesis family protein